MTRPKTSNKLTRLLALACRLLQGARLAPRATAQELGVSERTVWRDLDLLSGYLPIASDGRKWGVVS